MPPKSDLYSFNQIREIMQRSLDYGKEWRNFNEILERNNRENGKKDTRPCERKRVTEKRSSRCKDIVTVHSDVFDKKVSELENILKLRETGNESISNELIKDKLAELEDRSRRNNLRFEGIVEEENESWKRSEEKIKIMLKENLNIENKIYI